MGANGALGTTFMVTRVLQAASMVAVIGIVSNFVAQIVAANRSVPTVLVGTLSTVCVAVLYCIITWILYLDRLLPFLINTIVDGIFLIALIVVSVVVGKPLSYLDCKFIGDLTSSSSRANSFASALESGIAEGGMSIKYGEWIGTGKATCLEMKSIWGVCIALCILFFLSSITTLCLWRSDRKRVSGKGEGGATSGPNV